MAEKRAIVRTTLELPIELHASLKAAAERDRRSLHQELIYILEKFVEQDRPHVNRPQREREA
jgi:hypothetical protein